MKRSFILSVSLALFALGCSNSNSTTSTTAPSTSTIPTFTATLLAANEVPPIVGAEAAASGSVTITIPVVKDAAGNITAATATFEVKLAGFPAGSSVTLSHIHQAAVGVAGAVVVNTALASGDVTLSGGAASYIKGGIAVDPALATSILNGPSGFYFNVHTAANPGGVVRGQLVRTQ